MTLDASWLPLPLTPEQLSREAHVGEFMRTTIEPRLAEIEVNERFPADVVAAAADAGIYAAPVPVEYGGLGYDDLSLGLLCRALGDCAGLLSLFTVHAMVCASLRRWGSAEAKKVWLPLLAKGEVKAAFALSEPNAGSDHSSLEMRLDRLPSGLSATGKKNWISCGQDCDIALLFGLLGGKATAILAPLTDVAVRRVPLTGTLGFHGAIPAELHFENCELPRAVILGAPGFGLSVVANQALELGRLCISWGCVGLAERCLERTAAFTRQRLIGQRPLAKHDLVRQQLGGVFTELTTSRLLCYHASLARSENRHGGLEACMAKYAASSAARNAAETAMRLLGAAACASGSWAKRLWHDAKIMEAIEGTSEVHALLLGSFASGATAQHRDRAAANSVAASVTAESMTS